MLCYLPVLIRSHTICTAETAQIWICLHSDPLWEDKYYTWAVTDEVTWLSAHNTNSNVTQSPLLTIAKSAIIGKLLVCSFASKKFETHVDFIHIHKQTKGKEFPKAFVPLFSGNINEQSLLGHRSAHSRLACCDWHLLSDKGNSALVQWSQHRKIILFCHLWLFSFPTQRLFRFALDLYHFTKAPWNLDMN